MLSSLEAGAKTSSSSFWHLSRAPVQGSEYTLDYTNYTLITPNTSPEVIFCLYTQDKNNNSRVFTGLAIAYVTLDNCVGQTGKKLGGNLTNRKAP